MEKGFKCFIGNMNTINENQQFIDNNINNDSKYEKIEIEEETNLFPLQKNISPQNQIILKK